MTFVGTAEMTKSTEGAGVISVEKMELEELVLVRLRGGNWKPGCQVRTTAGSLSPFPRSSCDLGRKLVCLETDDDKLSTWRLKRMTGRGTPASREYVPVVKATPANKAMYAEIIG